MQCIITGQLFEHDTFNKFYLTCDSSRFKQTSEGKHHHHNYHRQGKR